MQRAVFRNQWYFNLEQNRGASPCPSGRHRAGGPELPQVSSLWFGTFRWSAVIRRGLSADRILDVWRGAAANDQESAAGLEGGRQARSRAHAAPHQLHF